MDETTDVTSTKVLAVVIKYSSEKNYIYVKTKFLTLVNLGGESAQHLFETLFTYATLDITQATGFGADTTNVMFGNEGE